MAINKKLIHFENKQNFDNEVANGNILNHSIVFIQDSKEISTHGTVYKTVNWSYLGKKINNCKIYMGTSSMGELRHVKKIEFDYPIASNLYIIADSSNWQYLEVGSLGLSEGYSPPKYLGSEHISNGMTTNPAEDDVYIYKIQIIQ